MGVTLGQPPRDLAGPGLAPTLFGWWTTFCLGGLWGACLRFLAPSRTAGVLPRPWKDLPRYPRAEGNYHATLALEGHTMLRWPWREESCSHGGLWGTSTRF